MGDRRVLGIVRFDGSGARARGESGIEGLSDWQILSAMALRAAKPGGRVVVDCNK